MATTVIVNFKAVSGKEDLLLEELREIQEVLNTYQKCHKADLFISEQEFGKMMLIEQWESSADHQNFFKDLQENGAFDQIKKLFADFSYNYFEQEGEI